MGIKIVPPLAPHHFYAVEIEVVDDLSTANRLTTIVSELGNPQNNRLFIRTSTGARPTLLQDSPVRKKWAENTPAWTGWDSSWFGDLLEAPSPSSHRPGDKYFFDSRQWILDLESFVRHAQPELLQILTDAIDDLGVAKKKQLLVSEIPGNEIEINAEYNETIGNLKGVLNDITEYDEFIDSKFLQPWEEEKNKAKEQVKSFGSAKSTIKDKIEDAYNKVWNRLSSDDKAIVILVRREIKITDLSLTQSGDSELKKIAKEDDFFRANKGKLLLNHLRSEIELDPDISDKDIVKGALEQIKRDLQFTPQCFLLYHIKKLKDINRKRPRGLGIPYKKTFILDTKNSHSIMNRLTRMSDPTEMLDLPTWKMAKLVPNFRIYKVLYEKDSQQIKDEIEFKFPNFTYVKNSPNKLLDAMDGPDGTSLVKTKQAYGIKSFDWKYIGTDPFTYKNDIEATLVLYLQDFEQLKIKRISKGHEYRLLDLLVPSGPPTIDVTTGGGAVPAMVASPATGGSVPGTTGSGSGRTPHQRLAQKNKVKAAKTFTIKDKYYYDIKVQVGWASKEDTKKNLFLTMVDYDIQFSQEGVFELTINYRARLEGTLYDKRANVLRGKDSFEADLIRRGDDIKRLREQGADSDRIAKLTDELSDLQRAKKQAVFSMLMKNLQTNNCIYFGDLTSEEILAYKFGGAAPGITRGKSVGTPSSLKTLELAVTPYKKPPDPEDGSEGEEEWKPFLQKIQKTGKYRIHYFFLGDLIEIMARRAINPRYFDNSTFLRRTSLLLSVFDLLDPQDLKTRINPTFADIPISVETFNRFFFEKVISYDITTYPIMKMIRDIMSHLVLNIFSECFGHRNIRNSFRLGFFSLEPKDGKNPMKVFSENQFGPNPFAIRRYDGTKHGHFYIPDYQVVNMDDKINIEGPYGISQNGKTKDAYHFFIIYSEATDPSELRIKPTAQGPDYLLTYKRDLDAGIYHLYIGRDKGLVKNISFAKTDQEYLREQRFTQESEVNPYAILSNVFDVTIQMYGNTLFYPGQRVFIYPSGGFSSLGRPWIPGNDSNTLGLGGYHIVTEVSSKIESGKFETTLKARWETSGDGISPDPSVNQSRGTGTGAPSTPASSKPPAPPKKPKSS